MGDVVMLNGVPRSGKSSIATALVATDPAAWVNLGVDQAMAETPTRQQPGIGLRPGDDRPDLRSLLPLLYDRLWSQIDAAACSQTVAVDVGLYDGEIHRRCLDALAAHRLLCVKVWCPLETIVERRRKAEGYVDAPLVSSAAQPTRAWHDAVYGLSVEYALEVDTSVAGPDDLAARVLDALRAR